VQESVVTLRITTGSVVMSYTLDALLDQAIDNYPVTAMLSPEIVAVLFYALSQIENPDTWLDPTRDPMDVITDADRDQIDELVAGANLAIITPEVGFVKPYITTNPPDNTIPCDGGTYNREDYPLLYAVIDSVFIVDSDTFTTPDLRGLALVGAGTVGARTFTLGDTGGEYDHTLDTSEIPSHSHSDIGHAHSIPLNASFITQEGVGVGRLLNIPILTDSTGVGFANIQNTGGSGAHNNMQPFGVVKYCVQAR
jgi:microcystin-dependent protein